MLIQNASVQSIPAISPNSHHSPEVRALVARSLPSSISYYRPNRTIYGQGDEATHLYLVVTGTVRICQVTPDGRRQVNGFFFPGEVFGFEAGNMHHSSAESVDGAGVQPLRSTSKEGYGAAAMLLALRGLERAHEHQMLLARMSAVEKLAAFFLDLIDRQDADDLIDLPMPRLDIADYLGLTFETVSRALKVLKDRRIIRLQRTDQVDLVDPAALEALRDGTA